MSSYRGILGLPQSIAQAVSAGWGALRFDAQGPGLGTAATAFDFQVAGQSRMSLNKQGRLTVGDPGSFAPIALNVLAASGQNCQIALNGQSYFGLQISDTVRSTVNFITVGFTSSLGSAGADVHLTRDAAGILAQRNGVNAQTQRTYETFTDASNGAWLAIRAATSRYEIVGQANGTGVVREVALPRGMELDERTAPTSPAADRVRIYAEDNGAGKTRLMALFPTGAAQQIAIEP